MHHYHQNTNMFPVSSVFLPKSPITLYCIPCYCEHDQRRLQTRICYPHNTRCCQLLHFICEDETCVCSSDAPHLHLATLLIQQELLMQSLEHDPSLASHSRTLPIVFVGTYNQVGVTAAGNQIFFVFITTVSFFFSVLVEVIVQLLLPTSNSDNHQQISHGQFEPYGMV